MPNRNLLVFNKIKETKCPHVVLIDSDLFNNIQDFIIVKLFIFFVLKKKNLKILFKKNSNSTVCSICSTKVKDEDESSPNLWLCLHDDCKMLFSNNESNNELINHKKEHFDSKNHSIMFDLNSKLIYCALCKENIDLDNNNPSSKK
jgi:hypothetical protein